MRPGIETRFSNQRMLGNIITIFIYRRRDRCNNFHANLLFLKKGRGNSYLLSLLNFTFYFFFFLGNFAASNFTAFDPTKESLSKAPLTPVRRASDCSRLSRSLSYSSIVRRSSVIAIAPSIRSPIALGSFVTRIFSSGKTVRHWSSILSSL